MRALPGLPLCAKYGSTLVGQFGVTRDKARAAFQAAAVGGRLGVMEFMAAGLGADNNRALKESIQGGHLHVVVYLKETFGLTRGMRARPSASVRAMATCPCCDALWTRLGWSPRMSWAHPDGWPQPVVQFLQM